MLRLRVQNYGETDTSNSYVTDMGIRGDPGKDYFFITAPQNTSNVGDQNTFVISSTSNVGIGTTNPVKPLHVVGDSWVTGTLTASNIIGASPVTISSNLVMASGFTLTAGAIEPPEGSESNLKIAGTITTSNIVANTGENLLVSSNLEVGTSNLFVDTATGRVGIGTNSPKQKLEVGGNMLLGQNNVDAFIHGGRNVAITADTTLLFVADVNSTSGVGAGDSDIVFGYGSSINTDTNRDFTFAQAFPSNLPRVETMRIKSSNGYVGIGVTSPNNPLHILGGTDCLYLQKSTSQGGVGIKFSDITTEAQSGYLRFYHNDTESGGFGASFKFSTTESSDVVMVGGALMIGTDGKDGGNVGSNTAGRRNLFITTTFGSNSSANYGWWIGAQNEAPTSTDNDLYFTCVRAGNEHTAGLVQDGVTGVQMNFTGQHRTFVTSIPYEETPNYEGMIVSANTNNYVRMSGGIAKGLEAITINESLPLVSLSNVAYDKKCFGVISYAEDPDRRTDGYGNFVSVFEKESGDTRIYINSVGEGAIWIVNTNGNLESGDYITTSNIAGYGQKQDDDLLHNYTVAKITMDCDFNPPQQPVQIILKDAEGNNILDQYGQIQWVDDTDGTTEPAYKTRQLEGGYIAAFVGCTYHCG